MGSDRSTRTTLVARCCYGVSFGFGFVLTVLTLTVMFWIAWFYFGLTIVQISDSQRRAVVNYSYTSSKPLPSPTTAAPSRSTTVAIEETSINSISKLPTTSGLLRGSSRGESQVKFDKKKEASVVSSLAKGDFADRDRGTHDKNVTALPSKVASSVIHTSRGSSQTKDDPVISTGAAAASILSGSAEEELDDRVYARKVFPPGTENRPEEKGEPIRRNLPDSEPKSRSDISPTKVHEIDTSSESSREVEPIDRSREETRTPSRDIDDREKPDTPIRDPIQSSRRSESTYREPDIDRESPRRYAASSDRGKSRSDDIDDDREYRGRYDKTDRGRESDDRYSKGDTRVYPDDRDSTKRPASEDRYRSRERYSDDDPKRGDDDRYDGRETSRSRDRDATPYKDVESGKPPVRDDRYRDDDRYRSRDGDKYRDRDDDRYRSRDDDKYRSRDDDKYRSRDDERYRSRVDDVYKPRDEESYRSRDDDRYKSRDDERYRPRYDDRSRPRDDDRYRPRDDDVYRPREDDRNRPRDDRYKTRDDDRLATRIDDRSATRIDDRPASRIDDRYKTDEQDRYRTRDDDKYRIDRDDRRDVPVRSRGEEDRYRSKTDDSKYDVVPTSRLRDTDPLPVGDRKPPRSEYDVKVSESAREDLSPSRLPRPSYDEDRYRDRDRDDNYKRPSRYEDDERTISPTRTRDDGSISRSSLIDVRPKDVQDGSRYVENPRIRDDRNYDEEERIRATRLQESKSPLSTAKSSRTYNDDTDRYRTRLPNEKLDDRSEEVVLDRRSYASEEDSGYRRGSSRTNSYYEDRTRSPTDDTRRRYKDDEGYPRRDTEARDDYKSTRTRDDEYRDRTKTRDGENRRNDEKYVSRDEDRYNSRGDRLSSVPPRKYDDDDDRERPRRRDPDSSVMRKEDSRDREERIRPSLPVRDEVRPYNRDDYSESRSAGRRYDDDDSRDVRDRDTDDRRYSGGSRRPVEPILGSSRDPSDVVIREKRFQDAANKNPSSRVVSNERINTDLESNSREHVRPLSAKDVIEAAIKHSDSSDQNSRKVSYPVFDPRVANFTSPEIIRPGDRRGTTITAKKR